MSNGSPCVRRLTSTLALVVPLVLSVALTVLAYDRKPLWRDEFYTLSTAGRSTGAMLDLLRGSDIGLTGFYSVMHVWLWFGGSSAWLRLPAALATVGLAVMTALLARHIAGTVAGLVAGSVASVLPAVASHAQEARAYPLVLLSLVSTVFVLLRYTEEASSRRAWLLVVVSSLACGLHPVVGLPATAAVFAAALAFPGAARRRRLVVVGAPSVLLGVALLGLSARQQGARAAGRTTSGWEHAAALPGAVAGPWWADAIVWLAAVGGVLVIRIAVLGGLARTRLVRLVMVLWVCAPFCAVAVLGAVGSSGLSRYASAASPGLAILAGVGVSGVCGGSPRGRRTAAPALRAVLGVVLGITVIAVHVPPVLRLRADPYFADDPRSAASALAAGARSGDAVIYNGATARGLIHLYSPALPPAQDVFLAAGPVASDTISGREVAPERWQSLVSDRPHVWMVGTTTTGDEWTEPRKAEALAASHVLVQHRDHGGYRLQLWSRRHPDRSSKGMTQVTERAAVVPTSVPR